MPARLRVRTTQQPAGERTIFGLNTAIQAVGSAKRRTMAGVEANRIAPNATPMTMPVVR